MRRLTAILSADIAHYSALMAEDEESTLAALRQLRSGIFAPTVARHGGKIVKNMGDGWLVEFTSAVDAVACAAQLQRQLSSHDTMRLRIGIHIGDVVHDEEDIFGDGVNIASRLERFAEPGTIIVSDSVYAALDRAQRKTFEDAGN